MGRHQKPENIKNLQSNPGKRNHKKRNNANFDFDQNKKFGMPHGLSKVVRDKFRAWVNYLLINNVSVDLYRSMVERYAEHLQIAYEAKAIIKKEGQTAVGGKLELKKHPSLQIYKDNSAAAFQIENFFSKLLCNIELHEEKKNPLDEWLGQGKKPHAVK